jgi:glycosyltransferase involved in cell wall biosynthesis
VTTKEPDDGARRASLLVIGWYRVGMGLSRVLESAFRHLAGRWQIDVAAIGYDGPVIDVEGIRIHPSNRDGSDLLAAYAAIHLIEERRPDVVLCFNDVWYMQRYADVLRPHLGPTRLAAYVPLDGGFADPEWARGLSAFDLVCVYTVWARDEVARAWTRLGIDASRQPPIVVVPHGVDVAAFQPTPELLHTGFAPAARAIAKRLIFPGLEHPDDTFIVLNASRPDPRKRIDLTLEGFASFARDKPPGVRLCLHHALGQPGSAGEFETHAASLGIADRLLLNPLADCGRVPSDDWLNLLYNACDVGLNTSMGEGWGLVSFEHAAAGAAQVVPHHSACADLWTEHAVLVPARRRYVPEFSILELAEVAPADVAAALDRLYADHAEQVRLARAGYDYVRRAEFRWEAVAERWTHALSHLVTAAPK